MNINKNVFARELARNCLTLKELSAISGVNVVTLTRVKRGIQIPQPITVGKIAKALNISIEDLVSGEEQKEG